MTKTPQTYCFRITGDAEFIWLARGYSQHQCALSTKLQRSRWCTGTGTSKLGCSMHRWQGPGSITITRAA